jgi:hypothetical protein
MPDPAEMEQLVHEALNLVVRARRLDEGILAKECQKLGSYAPEHTECLTPHVWLLDQYDTDLKEWEIKARNALSGTGRKV